MILLRVVADLLADRQSGVSKLVHLIVLQQVEDVVVVDLDVADKHSVGAVFVHLQVISEVILKHYYKVANTLLDSYV